MKKIGVIGLGSIGMRHAKNLLATGHDVCAYDPRMFQDAIDIPFINIEDMVKEVEAIVIASPTNLHLEHIQLTEGVPVFVEKPLANVLPMYIEHVRFVGNNLRFHSCVKQAKRWLEEGLLGEVRWARFTIAQRNDRYKDHVILNWGSHEIDLATYLLGPAKVVAAEGSERVSSIQLQHDNGVSTHVYLDYLTEPHGRWFEIGGRLGAIGANLEQRVAWLSLDYRVAAYHKGADTWNDNYIEEMQAFIDRIDGKEALGATGADGLKVLGLCLEAIRLSQS